MAKSCIFLKPAPTRLALPSKAKPISLLSTMRTVHGRSQSPILQPRPQFDQTVTLQSEQAQRVYEREFRRVVEALYAIDAILRIIGDSQEADTVESMVSEMIGECAKEIKNEQARFDKLKEDNGITAIPRYTHPGQFQIRIVSPQAAQFAALLKSMDALMVSLDTLVRGDGQQAARERGLPVAATLAQAGPKDRGHREAGKDFGGKAGQGG